MLNKYYYTEKEKIKLLKSLVVLVDTREQKNTHIINWFDKNKKPWKKKALPNGDYSFMIPKDESLNIERDMYFDKEIMVERKANLTEIGNNFTNERARLEKELSTYSGKKYLLLENSRYDDIIEGNYRNDISAKAFLATLHTFNHRYNWEIVYMPTQKVSGMWVYGTFYYYFRNLLR